MIELPSSLADSFIQLPQQQSLLNKEIRNCKKLLVEGNLDKGKKAELEMWLLFAQLSPVLISKEPITLKINGGFNFDLIVVFADVIILVECKEGHGHYPSQQISKMNDNKTFIQNYFKSEFKLDRYNFIYIFYYSEFELSQIHFDYARERHISLLTSKHLDYYSLLINKLKSNAREIIFSDFLVGKRWPDRTNNIFNISALKGKIKDLVVYTFITNPKILKRICYVHKRNMQFSLQQDDIAYQRIINPNKIKLIQEFIIDNNRYFPTSILINFNKNVKFYSGKKTRSELEQKNIETGYLSLPEEYGYAWIIDGQHRVYGFSGLDKESEEHVLSAIALVNASSEEQARLYVEINENQTPIPSDNLWDIYTQLYEPTSKFYLISWLVKQLNKKNNYLKNLIYIPSLSDKPKKQYNIFLNNIANSILKSKKILNKIVATNNNIDQGLFYFIYDRFFTNLSEDEEIKKNLKSIDGNFYLSNNGIARLIYVYDFIYDYLLISHINLKELSNTKLTIIIDKFSRILIKALKKFDIKYLNEVIKESSEGARRKTVNEILIEMGKQDQKFKEIANNIFLSNIEEDLVNEFKETVIYDIKEKKLNHKMFVETILGTICGFINKGINGTIYVGISDEKEIIGLQRDLEYYHSIDELINFIQSEIKDRFYFKNYLSQSIIISLFKSDPIVLKIDVTNTSSKSVSLIKGYDKKFPLIFLRKTARSEDISKNFEYEVIPEKVELLKILTGEFYRNLNK